MTQSRRLVSSSVAALAGVLLVPALPVGQAPNQAQMVTHTVAGVKRLELETTGGSDAALEIEDGEGRVTIMHFEAEGPAS